jgi:ketosteroid isomerase-like protein
VQEIRISGNLAVARGTQETKTIPKTGGDSIQDNAKWLTVFQRQPDGSWEILWEIYNSNLPLTDSRSKSPPCPPSK